MPSVCVRRWYDEISVMFSKFRHANVLGKDAFWVVRVVDTRLFLVRWMSDGSTLIADIFALFDYSGRFFVVVSLFLLSIVHIFNEF